jgi:hypothetical protein
MNLTCDKVVAKYPHHFSGPRQIECDDGWADLIDQFITELDKIPFGKELVFFSIKEKFGRLRIDVHTIDEHFPTGVYYPLESKYEKLSGFTCEVCGMVGRIRGSDWWKTLCDKHEAERQIKDRV